MALAENRERPAVVSVIGWVWLVLALLLAAKALIDVVVWRVMKPAMPVIMDIAGGRSPEPPRYVRYIVEHLTEVKIAQAVLWIAVAAVAAGFLRLRPWARTAMQAFGWIGLAYMGCVIAISLAAWRAMPPAGVGGSASERAGMLVGGFAVSALIVAVFVAMIVALRRRDVREAFGEPEPESA